MIGISFGFDCASELAIRRRHRQDAFDVGLYLVDVFLDPVKSLLKLVKSLVDVGYDPSRTVDSLKVKAGGLGLSSTVVGRGSGSQRWLRMEKTTLSWWPLRLLGVTGAGELFDVAVVGVPAGVASSSAKALVGIFGGLSTGQ